MTILREGLLVGAMLAATEGLTVVLTGRNIDAAFLMKVGVFDLLSGLLAAAIAAVIRRGPLGRREDYASRFVPIAVAVAGVYTADKVFLAAVSRAMPIAVAAALLGCALAVGLVLGLRVCRRLARTRHANASATVSLLLAIPFLVVAGHVSRASVHDSSGRALVRLAVLAVALLLGLVGQDRLFARRDSVSLRRLHGLIAAVVVAALALALALVLAGERRAAPLLIRVGDRVDPRVATPNVLLISIDTLRADRLSVYGYRRDTTPVLRHLAAESLVFTHAVSPGTWTVPGHAAMLTGCFPGGLGALALDGRLPSDAVTLAERLAGVGYRTGGVVANASSLYRGLGWEQGFDFYSDEPRRLFGYRPSLEVALSPFPLPHERIAAQWRTAAEVNEVATEWLATTGGRPFFLFLNYMDTHDPYVPPELPDRYPGRLKSWIDPTPSVRRGYRDLTAAESENYRALYDGAVAYVDEQIGRLLSRLRAAGTLDKTLVIVTSDHGEFFGEHRLLRHEIGPYEQVHRIPLLIRYPGQAQGAVEQGWVQLVDIVPTVLAAVGIAPPLGLDGEPLPHVRHAIVIQQAPRRGSDWMKARGLDRGYTGLYEGSHKIVLFDDGTSMLFDLERDPDEQRDVAVTDAPRTRLMLARLGEANTRYPRRSTPVTPDGEAQERLRALGYVQ